MVFNLSGAQSTLGATDAVAAQLDELHFDLGEGPQWAAIRSDTLIAIPDVAAGHDARWPMFGAAMLQLPVGALFCVPMRMGAVVVGAVTLYRKTPGELSFDQQNSALAIGSAIAGLAVQRAVRSASDDTAPESATMPALRREVHQATGMILVQLDTTATIAYARLQAYAFATGRSVQSVARDVVARTLNFKDLPGEAGSDEENTRW